ncbi:MAG: thioredoxin domain-containing protein [Patescibacteria group bacterium]|nr:thioredoxin domain-containing protein [Patescibacteria group bacterium]
MPNNNSNNDSQQNAAVGSDGVPLTKKERRRLKREKKRHEKVVEVRRVKRGRWGWWLLIIIIIAAAVFGIYKLTANSGPSGNGGGLVGPVTGADWRRGPEDASVVLVEFSDFQCPACAFYAPWTKQLTEDFPEDLAVVYRHFPLSSIYINAEWAARATEAAGLQDSFWEMHDLLFDRQGDWAERLDAKNLFIEYAASLLGLNATKFKQDMNNNEAKRLVLADRQSGVQSGVRGTPTFFLNGVLLDTPPSYDDFADLIRAEFGVVLPTQTEDSSGGDESSDNAGDQ